MKSTEIAKIAGVSRSTVSKVINNYSDVNAETRAHVLKIIKKYNYSPDFSASVLAGKKTNTIGFFMNVDKEKPSDKLIFDSSLYSPVLNAVVDYANDLKYFVTVMRISNEDAIDKVRRVFSEKRIDSAIIIGADDEMVSGIAKLPYPIVFFSYEKGFFEKRGNLRDKMAMVSHDAYNAVHSMVCNMIDNGYKSFGIFMSNCGRIIFDDRYRGFLDALKERGIPLDDDFVVDCHISEEKASKQLQKLIDKGKLPEIFICINDNIAIAVMETLKKNNIKIPDDISVVGFDDIPEAKYMVPPVTTIKLPIREMATMAGKRAIEMITNNDFTWTEDIFETKQVIRKSTKSRF